MAITISQATRLIRARMAQAGLTQDDLATRLQLSQGTISKKLTGKRVWTPEELAHLAAYLEYPLLLTIAVQRGYRETGASVRQIHDSESQIGATALSTCLRRLAPRERQTFYLFAALMLGGLAPDVTDQEVRILRTLSHFDLAEVPG